MAPRSAGAALVALVLAAAAPGQEEAPPLPERITRTVTVLRAEDQVPIEGATVEIHEEGRTTEVRTTGRDGTAEFLDSPLRDVVLVARAPGRACRVGEVAEELGMRCTPGQRVPVAPLRSPMVYLVKGRVVEGRVVSAEDGRPVVGVPVVAHPGWRAYSMPAWTAVSDELGRYRTDQGIDGEHWIQAEGPNWVSDPFHFSDRHSHVPPTTLDLPVLPAGTLRGLVLDASGAPAQGVSVSADPPHLARGSKLSGRTGDDGRFAFPGALVDVPYTLRAVGDESRSPACMDVRVPRQGGEAERELRLALLGTVLVRVSGEGGLKLFLTVDLDVPGQERPHLETSDHNPFTRFDGVFSGTYTLRVDARGWLPHVRTVEVIGGKTVEVDVTLSPGASLGGTVVDGAGEPVADLRMHAAAPDPEHPGEFLEGEEEEAFSDEEGRFLFEGLREGPVAIRLDRGVTGYALDAVVRAAAPGKDLRIVVRRK